MTLLEVTALTNYADIIEKNFQGDLSERAQAYRQCAKGFRNAIINVDLGMTHYNALDEIWETPNQE